jgi:hypothetical protein
MEIGVERGKPPFEENDANSEAFSARRKFLLTKVF